MATGVYISKNLTQSQLSFLHSLDDLEVDIFSLAEITKTLGGKVENISELMENLVH